MKDFTRNTKTVQLKEALNGFLDTYGLKPKYNETNLIASWEKIMGTTIASRTEKIYIKDRTLFLKISSSPLRQELMLAKSKMIELINKEIGHHLVEELVFF